MSKAPKPTRMKRAAEQARRGRMRQARTELANRHPEDRGEIMAGDWDHGAGMAGVLKDMATLGR